MNRILRRAASTLAVLSACFAATAAHAGSIGTINCSGNALPTPINYRISYLDSGVSSPVAQQGLGNQIVGKVENRPIVVHVALFHYEQLYQLVLTNRVAQTCVIAVTLPGGAGLKLTAKVVNFSAASAETSVGKTPSDQSGGYAALTLVYGGLQVTALPGGDDGGDVLR